jgi:hypothetical protein
MNGLNGLSHCSVEKKPWRKLAFRAPKAKVTRSNRVGIRMNRAASGRGQLPQRVNIARPRRSASSAIARPEAGSPPPTAAPASNFARNHPAQNRL